MGKLTEGAAIALREYGPAVSVANAYLEGVRDAATPEAPPREMQLVADFLLEASTCAGMIGAGMADHAKKVDLDLIGQYSLACEALKAVNGHRPTAQALELLAQQASDVAMLYSIGTALHSCEYPMFKDLHDFIIEIENLHDGTEASIDRLFSRN